MERDEETIPFSLYLCIAFDSRPHFVPPVVPPSVSLLSFLLSFQLLLRAMTRNEDTLAELTAQQDAIKNDCFPAILPSHFTQVLIIGRVVYRCWRAVLMCVSCVLVCACLTWWGVWCGLQDAV